MGTLKRILAKFFDYSIIYFILYYAVNELDIVRTHVLAKALLVVVPISWFFIERILWKFFQTTPGKALMGMRIKEKISFFRSKFEFARVGLSRLALYVVILGSLGATPLAIKHFENPRSALSISNELYKGWYEISDDYLQIHFPAKPEKIEDALQIPDHAPLPTTEYRVEHEVATYSVAYAQLPQKWLQYSDHTILKHAIKGMAAEMMNTEILSKAYADHGYYNGAVYHLSCEGKQILGKFVMKGSYLYKIEVTYNPPHSDEIQAQMELFSQSLLLGS